LVATLRFTLAAVFFTRWVTAFTPRFADFIASAVLRRAGLVARATLRLAGAVFRRSFLRLDFNADDALEAASLA
jgi:hypothetical protein